MKKLTLLLAVTLCAFAGNIKAENILMPETYSDQPPAWSGSFSQTALPVSIPTVSTNTNQQTAVDVFINSLFGGQLTNASVDLYATWAPKAPKGSVKVGCGLFVAYNFNQYAGAGLGLDWLGQFALVSGNVQFQTPFHLITVLPLVKNVSWLQNVIISPFTIAGVGTPYSGNGQFNGSAMVISDIGGYVTFGHVWNGQFNAGVAWGKWIGEGPYGGVTRYHAAFGYMKSF